TNTITAAIPGIALNIFQTSSVTQTLTVTQDSSIAVSAIGTFVSAYNAAINEINTATAPPVIQQNNSSNAAGSTQASSQQIASGGTLYGDFSIETLKDKLISLAQNIVHNGNSSFQSLSTIGLALDSSHEVLSANNSAPGSSTASTGPIAVSEASGTSGASAPFDLAKFGAAFAAHPDAVASIFTASDGIVATFGTYLTTVTGLPTTTVNGLLG